MSALHILLGAVDGATTAAADITTGSVMGLSTFGRVDLPRVLSDCEPSARDLFAPFIGDPFRPPSLSLSSFEVDL